MKKQLYLKLALTLIVLFSKHLHAELPQELKACGDQSEWPPFTYFAREGSHVSERAAGYNIDYLDKLLAHSGRRARVTLLPWIRCLALATSGQYDLILDAAKTPMREKEFAFPRSHYTMTPGFIYARSRPQPKVQNTADLAALNICGQLGYNYEIYGVAKDKPMARAHSFDAAIGMLLLGRCDLIMNYPETLNGYRMIGKEDYLARNDIGFEPVPWVKPVEFYIAVPRTSPYAAELVELIDQGIERMNKSGETSRLTQRYLGR